MERVKETLEQYFARPDTPMAGSPVGKLVARILAKSPGTAADAARVEAHKLLNQAARRRRYVLPSVLTAEQQTAEAARGREYWAQRRQLQTAA